MAANISTALADAIAAARTGRRAEARALLTEVAERRHILGLCYAQVGDFGRSIRELRAALAMGPGGDQLRDDLVTVEKAARAAGHRYAV
jgi:hypothetical protein